MSTYLTAASRVALAMIVALVMSALMMPSPALAGAGGDVDACIYLPVAPASPLEFQFKAGSSNDKCMYDKGKNASMEVDKSGLTCKSVGYVQANEKAYGPCGYQNSIWTLSYSVTNESYWTVSANLVL